MMQSDHEEFENIDKSVWLNPGESIITEERASKGDMKIERQDPTTQQLQNGENGDIRFAQAQVKNILNFLWEMDAIEDQHHHDGQTFQIWREMHQSSLGLMRAVSFGSDQNIGIRLRAYGFILVIKRLSIYDKKTIISSIETFANEHTKFLASKQRQIYRRAFERLSAIIPPVRDQIAYLEGLDEEGRNTLSEEQLKNFVALITHKN